MRTPLEVSDAWVRVSTAGLGVRLKSGPGSLGWDGVQDAGLLALGTRAFGDSFGGSGQAVLWFRLGAWRSLRGRAWGWGRMCGSPPPPPLPAPPAAEAIGRPLPVSPQVGKLRLGKLGRWSCVRVAGEMGLPFLLYPRQLDTGDLGSSPPQQVSSRGHQQDQVPAPSWGQLSAFLRSWFP